MPKDNRRVVQVELIFDDLTRESFCTEANRPGNYRKYPTKTLDENGKVEDEFYYHQVIWTEPKEK